MIRRAQVLTDCTALQIKANMVRFFFRDHLRHPTHSFSLFAQIDNAQAIGKATDRRFAESTSRSVQNAALALRHRVRAGWTIRIYAGA
jgi:hypothetical protein